MSASSFVLNHLAGKAGMTPRGIDSPALLRKTPPQRSRAVEVFVFLLSLKQFGGPHEISFALPALLWRWNQIYSLSCCVGRGLSAAILSSQSACPGSQLHHRNCH